MGAKQERRPSRKAKIVATVGPATQDATRLKSLIKAGVDAFRLNFSHGSHEAFRKVYQRIRAASRQVDKPVAVVADLQGPKVRVGPLAGNLEVSPAEAITLTASRQVARATGCLWVNRRGAIARLRRGDRLMVKDGLVEFSVLTSSATQAKLRVVRGGTLSPGCGVHVQGRSLPGPLLSRKDIEDLRLALSLPADYVALSFVRRAADLGRLRAAMRQLGREVPVIAKLEQREAFDHLDEIFARSEAVMIARGDMGVNFPPEEVPALQKEVIARANRASCPVITCTQMLESMIHQASPTRAEVSDVANAILDGSDAVMLSGETAVGKYPVEAVKVMDAVVRSAESVRMSPFAFVLDAEPRRELPVPDAICEAAKLLAAHVGASCIVAFTRSGSTARDLSTFRPETPILACTPDDRVYTRLPLFWGVQPFRVPLHDDVEALIASAVSRLKKDFRLKKGERIVMIMGVPAGIPKGTNQLRVVEIEAAGQR